MNRKVSTQWISVPSSGGQQFDAYLATPPSGKGPGIVLFEEIFGVNSHIQGVAEQYAQDGFVVLAPDLFWRQQRRLELGYDGDDRARAIEMMKGVKPAELLSDVKDCVATLRKRQEASGCKVGALGFCFGGRLAYLTAATTDVDAAVAYYGGGIHDQLDRAAAIRCPMQFHYAGKDDSIPLPAVDKVRAAMAGKEAEFFIYESSMHGFNCWDRGSYNSASAALARGRSLAFLAQKLF